MQRQKNTIVSIARSTLHTLTRPRVACAILEACVVMTLVVTTLGQRSWLASQRHLMPAGDVFNYQSIASNIRHFQYPHLEKRLPAFPVALLIGMELGFDPVATGVAINVLASAGTVGILYLLGCRFRLPKLPLALFLLLFSVAPLPTINGIRPLADGFFLFVVVLCVYLVTVARPTRAFALAAGSALTVLAFTRYEGIPLTFLLLGLLRFRIPWRRVLLAAAPLAVAILLWLPVAKNIYGSWSNFGYFKDARETELGNAANAPREYLRILRSAGWGVGWELVGALPKKDLTPDDRHRFASANAWTSVFGSLGILFLIFRERKRALPLLVAFAAYPVLPAYWFVYSRYVAPISALFFLSVGVGASALWIASRRLLRSAPLAVRGIAFSLLTGLFAWMVLSQAPALMRAAQIKAFENTGRGYALYQALQYLRYREERVVVASDYPMAYMMLGHVEQPKDGVNAGRGVYLTAFANASLEDTIQHLKKWDMQVVVDDNEEAVEELLQALRDGGYIRETKTFRSRHQNGDIEETHVHTLDWSPRVPEEP